MIETQVPHLGRGVRLRRKPDGSTMLLVPEGVLRLNATAAATLELVDGTRTVDAICDALAVRFGVARDVVAADVDALLERLVARGYVIR